MYVAVCVGVCVEVCLQVTNHIRHTHNTITSPQHSRADLICIYRVAVCCSISQCVAVCCSVLQCVVMCCSMLQRVASHKSNRRNKFVMCLARVDRRELLRRMRVRCAFIRWGSCSRTQYAGSKPVAWGSYE